MAIIQGVANKFFLVLKEKVFNITFEYYWLTVLCGRSKIYLAQILFYN
jgi:hypothetical protein